MGETQNTTGYYLIRDNPKKQLSLIDKYVKVEIIKNGSFEGFVQCFDPITNSLILSVTQDGGFKSMLIPGHGILDIVEHTAPSDIQPPRIIMHTPTPQDTSRKIKLMEWLKANLLPVSDDNDNIVFGNVSILPPYSVSDICTDSPMIAMQVKKLIENMPKDVKTELNCE